MQETLQNYPNLSIKAGSVSDMILGASEARMPTSSGNEQVYGEIKGIRTGMLPHRLSLSSRVFPDLLITPLQQSRAKLLAVKSSSSPPGLSSEVKSTSASRPPPSDASS